MKFVPQWCFVNRSAAPRRAGRCRYEVRCCCLPCPPAHRAALVTAALLAFVLVLLLPRACCPCWPFPAVDGRMQAPAGRAQAVVRAVPVGVVHRGVGVRAVGRCVPTKFARPRSRSRWRWIGWLRCSRSCSQLGCWAVPVPPTGPWTTTFRRFCSCPMPTPAPAVLPARPSCRSACLPHHAPRCSRTAAFARCRLRYVGLDHPVRSFVRQWSMRLPFVVHVARAGACTFAAFPVAAVGRSFALYSRSLRVPFPSLPRGVVPGLRVLRVVRPFPSCRLPPAIFHPALLPVDVALCHHELPICPLPGVRCCAMRSFVRSRRARASLSFIIRILLRLVPRCVVIFCLPPLYRTTTTAVTAVRAACARFTLRTFARSRTCTFVAHLLPTWCPVVVVVQLDLPQLPFCPRCSQACIVVPGCCTGADLVAAADCC